MTSFCKPERGDMMAARQGRLRCIMTIGTEQIARRTGTSLIWLLTYHLKTRTLFLAISLIIALQ